MKYPENYRSFLNATAICSFLGAITTTLLIFLPNPEASDFETRAALYNNGLYLSKLWILFVHPQANLLASFGIAFLLWKKYPSRVIFGTFFMLIWAFAEMSQQALLIDTLNQIWRPGYLGADNDVSKNMFTTLIRAASGISDSKYFLVIYGFGLGSLFYGLAMIWESGFAKWIGISLLFIGVLSLSSFARYYLGINALNAAVNWSYEWIYSYLQPLVRIAIGIWILLEVKNLPAVSTNSNRAET